MVYLRSHLLTHDDCPMKISLKSTCGSFYVLFFILSVLHLYGKTGRSDGNTNGTILPTGNFSGKKGIASDVVLFSRFYGPFASVTLAYHAPC